MKDKNIKKQINTAKDCAFLATFVAVVVAIQLGLSFVPGVELVTVLFVSFSFVMGLKRGMLAATVFSVIRQLVFGFYPVVLILYLVYFNMLTALLGFLGKKLSGGFKYLIIVTLIACLCTVLFSMFDNVLTPLWYGYSKKAMRLYFYGSLPFMFVQVISVGVSVFALFLPLKKVFLTVKEKIYS